MSFKLSVVVPTKNRQSILKNLLSSFISQGIDYPVEFIIIDQTPVALDSNSLKVLNVIAENIFEQCPVRYFHMPELSGSSQARNVGVTYTSGNIILFLDDDVILLPGFIKGIMEGFENGFDGVSGVQIQDVFNEGVTNELYTNIFFRGYLKDKRRKINRKFYKYKTYVETNVLGGPLVAYHKEIISKFKFDENFVRYSLGEDKEVSMRISFSGAKLAFCTKAMAYHMRHPVGKPDSFKRYEGKTAYIKYLQKKFSLILKGRLWISTSWALFGTFIDAFINSIIKRSKSPIQGAFSGVKKARQGFKDLEFIKIKGDNPWLG